MANDDRDRRDAPSLEPPSLGFSLRRKRRARQDDRDAAATPEPTVTPEPVVTAEPTVTPESTPAAEPAAAAPATPAPPLFVDEAPTPPRSRPRPAPAPAAEAVPEGEDAAGSAAARRPLLGGLGAAVFTGAFAGLLLVGATWATLRACEAVRGTSTCGDPGFFLLLTILAALVLVGGGLLRAFSVSDPFSTSFLGIGLLTVIALVFLVDVLFAWWMVIVIPVCGAATFALSHWVTTTFVEPAEG